MLYPNDATEYGKELRLKQQFFFVSASLQVGALYACSHVHFAPPALQKRCLLEPCDIASWLRLKALHARLKVLLQLGLG